MWWEILTTEKYTAYFVIILISISTFFLFSGVPNIFFIILFSDMCKARFEQRKKLLHIFSFFTFLIKSLEHRKILSIYFLLRRDFSSSKGVVGNALNEFECKFFFSSKLGHTLILLILSVFSWVIKQHIFLGEIKLGKLIIFGGWFFFQDNTTHITMNFFFRMPSDFLRNNKMIFFSTFGSALFFFVEAV